MYLIVASYENDAERKRIEYIMEKWRGRIGISKPDGIITFVDTGDIGELVEELYSRVSARENIKLYNIEEIEPDINELEKEITRQIAEKQETVEKLLDFIMARQKAVLKISDPIEKVYEIYTKKGKAEISTSLRETDSYVTLHLRISGYGEVVDHLYNKLSDELRLLEGQK